MLRCHGRFNNADITEETKVLIYLPRKSYWAELIVKEFHQKLFHAGLSHTLSQIRNRYWMPQGRTIVRNVIQHCEICWKKIWWSIQDVENVTLTCKKVKWICAIYLYGTGILHQFKLTKTTTDKVWQRVVTDEDVHSILQTRISNRDS